MNKDVKKILAKKRRHRRILAKLVGTQSRPRLCVFRSASHIYAQLIDDQAGKTVLESSSLKLKKTGKDKKASIAFRVGEDLAKSALEAGIKKAAFDRGGYAYHGRVRALAEGARKGGLEF